VIFEVGKGGLGEGRGNETENGRGDRHSTDPEAIVAPVPFQALWGCIFRFGESGWKNSENYSELTPKFHVNLLDTWKPYLFRAGC
jgi:hypothetical protein